MTNTKQKMVYLMRHGETDYNHTDRHQPPEVPLNEQGRRQAEHLAQRVAQLPIEQLIASVLPRAKETAEIVHRHTDVPLSFDEDLIECRNPSEILGLAHDDPQQRAIRAEFSKHANDPDWHYSDEETLSERFARANRVLGKLAEHEARHLGVITHGLFLHYLLLGMFGISLDREAVMRWFKFMHPSNTGLTLVRYNPEDGDVPWRVITWNDQAHLG